MKVLIVDDDPTSSKLLYEYLKAYGTCDTAANGDEAIHAVQSSLNEGEPYNLICLDIMMPVRDGHETLKCIRNLEHQANSSSPAKIVMVSALNDMKTIFKSFNELCDAYIAKPVTKTVLMDELIKLDLVW